MRRNPKFDEAMTFKQRTILLGLLAAAASAMYGVALYYAPALVLYVVEQTLIQKAPESSDGDEIKMKFEAHLRSFPDRQARLERILAVSQHLEKVQKLQPEELGGLIENGRSGFPEGRR